MSIEEQIKTLEELSAVDADLRIFEEELSQERGVVDSLKSNLARLEEKLKVDRAHTTTVDKSRSDFVLEVRTMMQQIEHSRDKLNRSRTERESNAAQREMEELRKLIRDREDEVGKLTTELDAARQSLEATEAEVKKVSEELAAREAEVNAKLGSTESSRVTRAQDREALVKKLPPALYRRYEVVRSKRGTGVAKTTDGTCKACHMALPPQLFHKLRREPKLEQCPSCNRIIYYAPTVVSAAKEG